MKERLRGFTQRSKKGSLVFWFLIIAIVGLTLVVGLVFLELLIRGVSLARVQNAANEAALVYARDMVRLRDEALSRMNLTTADFASANLPTSCSATGGCTPVMGRMAAVQGAVSMEYTNASQTFLYNIWGVRVSDPSEVDDVRQNQCYKPHNESRFSKIPSSPVNNCEVTNKISSPIMSLTWSLQASPYGTGVCCSNGGNDGTKDFCVDFGATGRMDPVIAGGLPFLTGAGAFDSTAMAANGRRPLNPVRFITVGDFEIHARAVVMRMGSRETTGDNKGIADNLSGETIGLEGLPSGAICAAPALTVNPPNPLTPPTSPYMPPPPQPPLPPDEVVNLTNPPYTPPSPLDPGCPPTYSYCQTFSQTSTAISYQCCPPVPPGPPPTCAQSFAAFYSGGASGEQVPQDVYDKFNAKFPACSIQARGIYGENRGTCFQDGSQFSGPYRGSCYCPIVLSFEEEDPSIDLSRPVKFSFDGKTIESTNWLKANSKVGLLAFDFNKNGKIDNGKELLGQHTAGRKFVDGYAALSGLFDKNKDGKIQAKELDGLSLWIDLNHDGKSTETELKTLKSLNVVELRIEDLNYAKRDILGGGVYPSSQRSVLVQGKKGITYGSSFDVWFAPHKEVAQSIMF